MVRSGLGSALLAHVPSSRRWNARTAPVAVDCTTSQPCRLPKFSAIVHSRSKALSLFRASTSSSGSMLPLAAAISAGYPARKSSTTASRGVDGSFENIDIACLEPIHRFCRLPELCSGTCTRHSSIVTYVRNSLLKAALHHLFHGDWTACSLVDSPLVQHLMPMICKNGRHDVTAGKRTETNGMQHAHHGYLRVPHEKVTAFFSGSPDFLGTHQCISNLLRTNIVTGKFLEQRSCFRTFRTALRHCFNDIAIWVALGRLDGSHQIAIVVVVCLQPVDNRLRLVTINLPNDILLPVKNVIG